MSQSRTVLGGVISEPASAAAFLLSWPAIIWLFQEARILVASFAPTVCYWKSFSMRLLAPSFLTIVGVAALYRVKSIDSLSVYLITSVVSAVVFAVGGIFVLANGYNFSKYSPVPLPRSQCVAYFALTLVSIVVGVVAARLNNRRRRDTTN